MTLQARGLAYARGPRKLFAGLDFEVKQGEALRVAGRNGSGKTSLLRLLCGLAEPLEGDVLWRGLPIRSQRDRFHQDLLYIGHGQGLKDDLSAWENVHISAVLADQPCTPAQARQALVQVGLGERAELPARALSQGQRRRVLLARLALASTEALSTRLLVLDEPFAALDQESVAALSALLSRQLSAGAAMVYTTHQPDAIQAAHTHALHLGDAVTVSEEAPFTEAN
jgi:heme exporter protein A